VTGNKRERCRRVARTDTWYYIVQQE